jgi:hypothetical protein
MKYLRIFLFLFLANLFFIISPLASFSSIQGCDTDYVILNSSPIDFDLLYCQDNSTLLNEVLNGIGNKSGMLPISPWGGFFTGSHIEGSDKWYFDSHRQLEIFCPHEAQLESVTASASSTIEIVQDNEVVTDVDFRIDIGDGFRIYIGHLTILKSIYDEIQSSGEYPFAENEHIGYQTEGGVDWYGLDFWYIRGDESICPFFALSPSLQTQVSSLYDLQYQRMKLCGLYPQSNICSEISIYIDDTIWGNWEYKTGPFDDYIIEGTYMHEYPFSFHTYYKRDFANPETYWKDSRFPYNNLTEDILGIFGDNIGKQAIPGYNQTGWSHVKLAEGSYSQGIMELCIFSNSDWAVSNTSIYAKFEILIDSEGYLGDELKIEYFTTLEKSQIGFSENSSTYIRFNPFGYEGNNSGFGYTTIFVGIITTMIFVTIRNRKEKNI